jgi:hypothetical protein
MKTICAYILAICQPHRLEWLKQNIEQLEKQSFEFDRKLVIFDEFNGHRVTDIIKTFLQANGWEYKIVDYHSRSRTMQETLTDIKEDYVYYIEDDVLLDLPPKDEVLSLFDIVSKDRICGHISPQIGDGRFCATNKIWSDVEYLKENTLYISNTILAFERLDKYKTDYFITFPCALFRTTLLKQCVNLAIQHFKGEQIETGITKAYFLANFDKTFYKTTICIPNTYEMLKENMFNERLCGFVTPLDPNQGRGFDTFGGNYI